MNIFQKLFFKTNILYYILLKLKYNSNSFLVLFLFFKYAFIFKKINNILICILLLCILYLQQQFKIFKMKQLTFASLQVKNLEASKEFYTKKLGFEIGDTNPQACIFKYNQGQASFAIRTPLERLEEKELGIGVALWFAVNENIDKLKEIFTTNGITTTGPIIETPFGRAFHVKDLDGYKLTFLNSK